MIFEWKIDAFLLVSFTLLQDAERPNMGPRFRHWGWHSRLLWVIPVWSGGQCLRRKWGSNSVKNKNIRTKLEFNKIRTKPVNLAKYHHTILPYMHAKMCLFFPLLYQFSTCAFYILTEIKMLFLTQKCSNTRFAGEAHNISRDV